ncbi:LEA type 2 family protein [Halorientalis pallida]|uniref:LEA type 2 family protein n=1 Tax=Halorientalis pallida TaxID=2479928 RepID=UPI00187D4601|nr:LEA type 2 family protein [Halorientalis pallida]
MSRAVALKAGGVVAAVLVLGVVAVGVLAATGAFAAPTVESTSYDWGAVTDGTTEIVTSVTVDNPNPVGVPGVVDVAYTARLNDVTLARGERSGVGFGPGTNTVTLTAAMENRKIADWWVTHVNGDEQSKLTVDATVNAPGFSREIPAKSSTVETDILGGFTTEGAQQVAFQGDPLLTLRNQRASWGEATAETTPLSFSADVENVHDYAVTLDGVAYVVEMNGVELGRGQREAGLNVAPGEAGSIDVTVALDSPKMADWWREHVTDDEVSDLSVRMYGYVVRDGERQRVPMRVFDRTLRLETDMLGGGGTSVEPVETPQQEGDFEPPSVTDTDQRWGAVTDATTEIETDASLDTPDDPGLAALLSLDVTQTTTINGVQIAEGSTALDTVEPGSDTLSLTSLKDNGEVPEWWARHLNDGERSQVVTTPTATADVGATKFDADLGTRESTVRTDLLAGMNGDRDEAVQVQGRTALVVTGVSSEWNRATADTAPIQTRTSVRNELATPVTVAAIDYTVTTNGVTLADRSARVGQVVDPESSDTVTARLVLDNSKMDRWWVRHVRNGEQSTFDVDVTATVSVLGQRERVALDSLGQEATIETDVLNASEG